MPALGTQLTSLIDYANLISGGPQISTMVESWAKVEEAVMVPLGIESGNPPNNVDEARKAFDATKDVVKAKLDTRIGRIFDKPVTMNILKDEKINAPYIGKAIEMNLISMIPARALIQSALMVSASEKSQETAQTIAQIPGALMVLYGCFNVINFMYPLIEMHRSLPGLIMNTVAPIVLGYGLAVFLAKRVKNSTDIAADRFREMF